MKTRNNAWTALLWTQALAGGCFSVDNLAMQQTVVDSSTATDRDSGKPDAGPQSLPDSDADHVDAAVATAVDANVEAPNHDGSTPTVACDLTHACGADQLCAPDGFCLDKCDASGVCIAATHAVGFRALVADGDTLFYMSEPIRDTFGNQRADAALWKLTADGTQTKLADLPENGVFEMKQQDTFVYWASGTKLWRAPKDGSTAAQALYPTQSGSFALLPNGRLALSTPSPGGAGDLVSFGSVDGTATLTAELSPTNRASGTLRYAEGQVYYVGGSYKLWSVDSVTLQSSSTGVTADNLIDVIAPYVYFTTPSSPSAVQRADLRAPTAPSSIAYAPPDAADEHNSATVLLQGDSLYRLASFGDPPTSVNVVRASLTATGQVTPLLTRSFAPPRAFYFAREQDMAVGATHVFITAHLGGEADSQYRGGLLYAIPLNP